MTDTMLSIGDLARQSGLSTHTLRFYEASGILQPIARASNGHRRYLATDVAWLAFVLRLKATGMPLAEIQRYASLRTQGESTTDHRLAMLKLHRQRLATQIIELSESAKLLDEKIQIYLNDLSGTEATKE